MNRKILHIDMDAFFAAVEQLDNPSLRGKPVIVGADPKGRGVVSTCSYEARKYGVHSAMPIREAFSRCPQGIFLPPRGGRYAEISRWIMRILSDYTPLVEPLSLDEAFLDLTGSEGIFGPVDEIGRIVVKRIGTEIGLAASIGIAPNKFLAKLASDLEKPSGFVLITRENAARILENLPVSKIWGVGPKTEEHLVNMGVRTIGALSRIDPDILYRRFGEAGLHLWQLANGYDDRRVETGEDAKSVGHEMTFQEDTADREYLAGVLLWLSDQVARRLRCYQLQGRVVTVKIRDKDFKTITRRVTLSAPTDFEEMIYREALQLAQQAEWGGGKVRLIGVSLSGFNNCVASQLSLFEGDCTENRDELTDLHRVIDKLKDKFGEAIVTKGSILRVKNEKPHP